MKAKDHCDSGNTRPLKTLMPLLFDLLFGRKPTLCPQDLVIFETVLICSPVLNNRYVFKPSVKTSVIIKSMRLCGSFTFKNSNP